MEQLNLKFSKKIFSYQLIFLIILCGLPFVFGGFRLETLLLAIFLMLLCLYIILSKSKTFRVYNNRLVIEFILLNRSVEFKKEDVDVIYYHKKAAERDDNYIKVVGVNGKVRKFPFLFVEQDARDNFFTKLVEHFNVEEY